jgi:hypothetical protein
MIKENKRELRSAAVFRLFAGVLTLAAVMTGGSRAAAQNVQLHYDFGRYIYEDDWGERPLLTSTVEMFKPDRFGSTFFFVDMDYRRAGIAQAYWEISRELKLGRKTPFSWHLEYNGGLNYIRNAYLTGLTFTHDATDFSRGGSLSAMYKYIQQNDFNEPHNFQLTATWYFHFPNDGSRLFTFSGFADWWRERSSVGTYIFLSEPQIWLHLNRIVGYPDDFNLSIGSEMEISYNFAARQGLFLIPTAALKWDF